MCLLLGGGKADMTIALRNCPRRREATARLGSGGANSNVEGIEPKISHGHPRLCLNAERSRLASQVCHPVNELLVTVICHSHGTEADEQASGLKIEQCEISAYDAVDGARSEASKCHRVVASSKPH